MSFRSSVTGLDMTVILTKNRPGSVSFTCSMVNLNSTHSFPTSAILDGNLFRCVPYHVTLAGVLLMFLPSFYRIKAIPRMDPA